LRLDPASGGLASLVHRATGTELVPSNHIHALAQTIHHDGKDHPLEELRTEIASLGPLLARLRTIGHAGNLVVTQEVTLYADLDWVDIDLRIHLPATTNEQRLCQFFPLGVEPGALHIETPAAVLRPAPQPAGDLLPGADTRRFAVQGFIGATLKTGAHVVVVPHDAFALRLDLGEPAFEALGNDQNYRESTKDQAGQTEFRFRYSIRVKPGPLDPADAIAWSRAVAAPWLVAAGRLPDRAAYLPTLAIDPARAIATCLKPSDVPGNGCILRLWETAGRSNPLLINAAGFPKAIQTDLVERDREFADQKGRTIQCAVRARGLASLRLMR
jgi:alpha-mannosidase